MNWKQRKQQNSQILTQTIRFQIVKSLQPSKWQSCKWLSLYRWQDNNPVALVHVFFTRTRLVSMWFSREPGPSTRSCHSTTVLSSGATQSCCVQSFVLCVTWLEFPVPCYWISFRYINMWLNDFAVWPGHVLITRNLSLFLILSSAHHPHYVVVNFFVLSLTLFIKLDCQTSTYMSSVIK